MKHPLLTAGRHGGLTLTAPKCGSLVVMTSDKGETVNIFHFRNEEVAIQRYQSEIEKGLTVFLSGKNIRLSHHAESCSICQPT